MSSVFEGCSNLTKIDLSFTSVPLASGMENFFKDCINLKEIQLPKNLNNITNFYLTFLNCKSLTSINLTSFNGIKNLDNVDKMFENCSSLKEVIFPHIQASDLSSTSYMFSGCTRLEYIDMGNFDTKIVEEMKFMFNDCKSLKVLNISKLHTNNLKNVTNIMECHQILH